MKRDDGIKKTFEVTLPDLGVNKTRTTRTFDYTHAVVVRTTKKLLNPPEYDRTGNAPRGYKPEYEDVTGDSWGVLSWHSSRELAEKARQAAVDPVHTERWKYRRGTRNYYKTSLWEAIVVQVWLKSAYGACHYCNETAKLEESPDQGDHRLLCADCREPLERELNREAACADAVERAYDPQE